MGRSEFASSSCVAVGGVIVCLSEPGFSSQERTVIVSSKLVEEVRVNMGS